MVRCHYVPTVRSIYFFVCDPLRRKVLRPTFGSQSIGWKPLPIRTERKIYGRVCLKYGWGKGRKGKRWWRGKKRPFPPSLSPLFSTLELALECGHYSSAWVRTLCLLFLLFGLIQEGYFFLFEELFTWNLKGRGGRETKNKSLLLYFWTWKIVDNAKNNKVMGVWQKCGGFFDRWFVKSKSERI